MKLFKVFWLLLFFLLAGCGSSEGYTIFDRREEATDKVVMVEVPEGTSRPRLSGMAQVIEGPEKLEINNKRLLIKFYIGGHDDEHLIAYYSNGRLSDSR